MYVWILKNKWLDLIYWVYIIYMCKFFSIYINDRIYIVFVVRYKKKYVKV